MGLVFSKILPLCILSLRSFWSKFSFCYDKTKTPVSCELFSKWNLIQTKFLHAADFKTVKFTKQSVTF